MTRILFVCLGNICRSPLAEGLFIDKLKIAGLEHKYKVDSAGTSAFHEGTWRTLEPERMLKKMALSCFLVHAHSANKILSTLT